MDNIRIDSHKLMYHPQRVAEWMTGKTIYPIEAEIGLSGACNHRCIFCAVDYIGYKPNFIDVDIILKNLNEMKQHGLKSVVFSGEGEPLMHPDALEIFSKTKSFGLDMALSTNGVLLESEKAELILPKMTWIRFSIGGFSEETYTMVQRGTAGDIQRVWKNLENAVAIKRKRNLDVTLGAQMVLLPENLHEMISLGKMVREIGLDYFTVKAFSQHPLSITRRYISYTELDKIEKELSLLETSGFNVYFRHQFFSNVENEKTYDECFALPFMIYINAKGDVYPCIVFVGNEEQRYGNLYQDSFSDIWNNPRTQEVRKRFSGEFLQKHCRKACRLDEMNKYLHELKHPGLHANFI